MKIRNLSIGFVFLSVSGITFSSEMPRAALYQCEKLIVGSDFETPGFYRKLPNGALVTTPFVEVLSEASKIQAKVYKYGAMGWGLSELDCSVQGDGFCISENYRNDKSLRTSVSTNAFNLMDSLPSEAQVINVETRADWGGYATGGFILGRNQEAGAYYQSKCFLVKTGASDAVESSLYDFVNDGTSGLIIGDWPVSAPAAAVQDTVKRLY